MMDNWLLPELSKERGDRIKDFHKGKRELQ
jgi:hypothetical protein